LEIVRPKEEIEHPSLHFDVAPAYDLVISLAAVVDPERFDLTPAWARGVRTALPSAVRRDLSFFFGDPASLGIGSIQLVPDLPTGEAAALVVALESLDPVDFVTTLLTRGSTDRALAPALRRIAREKGSATDGTIVSTHVRSFRAVTRKRFQSILEDPASAQRRYIALMRAYFDGWFATHYPDVLPFVVQRAKQGRRSIGKLPTTEVVARVTNGFTLKSPARSVTLVPSYYASPFVYVVRGGKDVVLVYGVRPAEEVGHAVMDPQTVRVLKALADETRLRILQMLARKPLYGQQLADALGVSHPTVSHHMAQLRIAGLTRTELAEDGAKTYSVRRDTVDAVCRELRSAFVESGLPEEAV
jgi:DNA-binding transcriptional ArsR family regulator